MTLRAGKIPGLVLAVGASTAIAHGACTLDRSGLLDDPTNPGGGSATAGAGPAVGGSGGVGGTGGFGGSGGSGGSGGTGGQLPVVEEWVVGAPMADGTLALAGWMTFVSPSVGKTSQTGTSSVRTGFGADAPRARDSGDGWGLSVESARTNVVVDSQDMTTASWTTGVMTVTTGVTSPGGDTTAVSFASTGSQFSNYVTSVTAQAFSIWTRGVTGGPPFSYFIGSSVAVTQAPAWTRLATSTTADITQNVIPADTRAWGAEPALTVPTETEVWALQAEPGAFYPSSYIPTSGSAVTREAERLYINDPTFFSSGYFDIEIVVAPRYASSRLADGAEHDLLFFDSLNRTFVRRVGGATRLCQTIGGAEVCTAPVTFAAEAELTVSSEHLRSSRLVSVAGVNEGTITESPASQPPLSAGASVELLGNGMPGAQECADLRRVTINVVP